MLMQVRHIFLVIFIIAGSGAFSQTSNSSPYTRYAFGDLFGNTNAYSFASGGVNIPFCDGFDRSNLFNQVNVGNPASYSYIARYRPVFSVGGQAKFLELNTETDQQVTNSAGLSDFAMGLPIGTKGGAAFGLLPYSTVGYDMVDEQSDDQIGDYSYLYNGSGGINKVFIGASRRIFDKANRDTVGKEIITINESSLAFGVNAYYLFGSYANTRSVDFAEWTFLDTRVQTSTRVSDFMVDGGMYYHYRFKDRKKLINKAQMRKDSTVRPKYEKKRLAFSFGATGSLATSVNAYRDNFTYTYRTTALAEFIEDTISYYEDLEGTLNLPISFGVGAALTYDKLRIGAQLKMQDWSTYSEEFGGTETKDILGMSYEGALGIEYQPSNEVANQAHNAFKRAIYKFGFRYAQTPLQINNTSLTEIGMSFGLALPIQRAIPASMLNFGVELGERGTTDNNLIQERFATLRVGVTIVPGRFDNWFYKRKYN